MTGGLVVARAHGSAHAEGGRTVLKAQEGVRSRSKGCGKHGQGSGRGALTRETSPIALQTGK